jgi:Tfp pilus assembly protein PilO
MKRDLSTRQLLVAGLAVGGLVIGLAAYFLLVAPQKSKASKLDADVQAAQAQLVAARRAPRVKGASVQAAELFRLSKAMPASDDVPGVLIQLSRVAGSSKVRLVGVRPSAEVPEAAGYSALPLAVTVSGKYANVTAFLARLHGLVTVSNGHTRAAGRLFVPNNLSLTPDQAGAVSATVNLDAFVYTGVVIAPPSASTTTGTTPGSAG